MYQAHFKLQYLVMDVMEETNIDRLSSLIDY